eukprot:Nitzschia sp. Nitz4//scaffold3_size479765//127406//128890//NITZ4_000055-RA/size479765-processed-gene-0.66-mRNA-1//1//CDS//3329550623//7187//frame0
MTPKNKNRYSIGSVRAILALTLLGVFASQWRLNYKMLDNPVDHQGNMVVPSNIQHQSLPQEGNQPKENPLDLFDSAKHPVFSVVSPSRLPLKAALVTIDPLVGEARHFLLEGILGSQLLHFVGIVSLHNSTPGAQNDEATALTSHSSVPLQPTDADLWLVDGTRVAKLKRQFLLDLLHAERPSWKVLLVDFSDIFPHQWRHYQKLGIRGRVHVRLAVRSITEGRHYIANKNSSIIDNSVDNKTMQSDTPVLLDVPVVAYGSISHNVRTAGGPTIHYPYAVRNDLVAAMEQERMMHNTGDSSSSSMIDVTNPKWDRPIDVSHLWEISVKEGKSRYRNDVSRLIRSWNGRLHNDGRSWKTSIEEQGERRHVGRNNAERGYVRALLRSKIVVVVQRDDWEDHYRLFEALVSGALVIHDKMLAPPKGLCHGENIVFFETLRELELAVKFYLENQDQRLRIAKKGSELALGRHRSWHRVEELVFGYAYTNVSYERHGGL